MSPNFSEDLLFKWYILQVKSGYEKTAIQNIEFNLRSQGLNELVKSLIIPSEEITEIKRGKKVITEKKFFSGYILLEARLEERLIAVLNKTKGVINILGNAGKPKVISDKEIDIIFDQMKNGTINNQKKLHFSVGDKVTVNDGPFHAFSGTVEDVDEDKQRLKVSVTIFGRSTPVDLSFTQVTKDNQ